MAQDGLGMVLEGHNGLGWFRVSSEWLPVDHGDLVWLSLVQDGSRRLMMVCWFRVVHEGPVWLV